MSLKGWLYHKSRGHFYFGERGHFYFGLTLGNTDTGQPIAQAIHEHGTTVQFGDTNDDAIAQFDSVANAITIDHSQSEMSPAVLAAHLAHEGTHVQWYTPDSIDQEYDAFKTEAAVWDTGKGIETNEQCDWVSDMIGKGEADAKRQIRKLYPYLPEN